MSDKRIEELEKRIAKLEEAIKEFPSVVVIGEPSPEWSKKQPTCKTCKDSGTISVKYDGVYGKPVPCPDCASCSCGTISKAYPCPVHAPKTSCTCGESTVIHREKPYPCYQAEPKTSCKCVFFDGQCPKCGKKCECCADPQPERKLSKKFYEAGLNEYDSDKFAQIAEEHHKTLLLDAEARGYSIGRKEAIEELRKKFEKAIDDYKVVNPISSYLRSKLFNG